MSVSVATLKVTYWCPNTLSLNHCSRLRMTCRIWKWKSTGNLMPYNANMSLSQSDSRIYRSMQALSWTDGSLPWACDMSAMEGRIHSRNWTWQHFVLSLHHCPQSLHTYWKHGNCNTSCHRINFTSSKASWSTNLCLAVCIDKWKPTCHTNFIVVSRISHFMISRVLTFHCSKIANVHRSMASQLAIRK